MNSHQHGFSAPPSNLREKIAQLVFVRIGSNLPPVRTVDEDIDTILSLLETQAIGGLVLFNGRWPDSLRTLEKLQSASQFPLC